MNLEFKKEMTDRIDLQQLMLDDEFLKSSRKLYLDEFEDEDIWWLNDESKQMLNRGYLLRGERVLDAIERVCKSAAKKYRGSLIDEHVAYKHFVRNVLLGWQSFSSPVWSNMGVSRGLPISCFGIYAGDSVESITDKLGEVILQTKLGGGTSGYFGELRSRGTEVKDNGKSSGAVSFMQMFDKAMEVVSQGGVRRGNFAAYLDIDHPDIEEFLQIKDIGSPIQNLFTGVSIPDWWMNDMFYGKDIAKRKIWAKILESRQEKGLPYILFSDAINRGKPDIYKELKLKIYASNLCSEIALPSSIDESFVCCLSSMNLELYDEWKDSDAIYWAILFLDAVMTEFIDKTENVKYLEQSHNFAKRHRALGLGVMGYHSYLQKNMIAFDDWEATQFNAKVFKQIYTEAKEASIELAEIFGPAPIFNELNNKEDMEDVVTNMRNTTLIAIAPTTSSSSILSQASPGIEPYSSNYFKAGLAKGNFMRANKYLKQLLIDKDKDDEEVWRSIMLAHGSVQHLDFLSAHEKNVFKTFKEISPAELISKAAQRQQYIDQMQSLNLLIPAIMDIKDVNLLYKQAWESGVKSLYYQRSSSVSKEMMTNFVTCQACEA